MVSAHNNKLTKKTLDQRDAAEVLRPAPGEEHAVQTEANRIMATHPEWSVARLSRHLHLSYSYTAGLHQQITRKPHPPVTADERLNWQTVKADR